MHNFQASLPTEKPEKRHFTDRFDPDGWWQTCRMAAAEQYMSKMSSTLVKVSGGCKNQRRL